MSNIDISTQANSDTTVTPFAYRRPRCAVRQMLRQLVFLRVARIGVQVITSASLISAGILVTGPIGAALTLTGICAATAQKDEQTPTEYRLMVIAHFEARGKTPPKWTRREVAK